MISLSWSPHGVIVLYPWSESVPGPRGRRYVGFIRYGDTTVMPELACSPKFWWPDPDTSSGESSS